MKVVLKNVSKKIGKNAVLKDVNVSFESGNIYGIIGRNGSGKTMLFRAMSGLMKSKGEIWVDEKLLGKDMRIIPNLGLIIENTQMYPEFSAYKNLKFLSSFQNKIGRKEIEEALVRVGLDPEDKRSISKYSLGMRQKVSIAQAIMEKPDILLLDEPTNGLDDATVKKFWEIMKEEKKRGALIVLASHSKDDILELADEVYHMREGYLTKE